MLQLGVAVGIQNHEGYLAGLNTSCGEHSIAYADFECDIMFHVIPLMPTVDSDEQQIHKKRHVSNDRVQVIWNENYRDYVPTVLKSHFNEAHIIINPIQRCKLFRIQIQTKDSTVDFGPLQDNMYVTKELLPGLVRQTCINANKELMANDKRFNKLLPNF